MNKELSKYLLRFWLLVAILFSMANGPALAAAPNARMQSGGGSQTQTSYADFNQACATPLFTRVIPQRGEGVELAAQFSDSFVGNSLDLATRWNEGDWGTEPFTPTVSGGKLNLPAASTNGQGGWVRSQTAFTRGVLEGVAEFGAGEFQHIGFGSDGFEGNRYFLFSTYNDATKLFVRVNNDATEQRTEVEPLPVGLHRYRIEWAAHLTEPLSDTIAFYLDDQLIDSFIIANASAQNFFVYISNDGTAPLAVDNIQVMPSYATSGTYESCVLDAGDMHSWSSVNWSAQIPLSTTLAVETRSSFDLNTWSNWTSVLTDTGSPISLQQRYAQYRLSFATTNPITSAVVDAMTMNYSSATLGLAMTDRDTVTATLGSPVTYALSVTVPQTQTYGLVVTHTLPAGLKYDSLTGVTTSGTTASPTVSASAPNDGSVPVTIKLDFGDAVFLKSTASITIPTVVANVLDNQAGKVFTASTTATYRNEAAVTQTLPTVTDSFTLVEPALTLSKTVQSIASPFNVNRLVTYRVTVTHPGSANTSPAYDVLVGDLVPAALTLQTPITVSVSGGAGGYTSSVITNTVAVTVTAIPPGGTVTLDLTARLNSGAQPGPVVANTAGVIWTSRAGLNADERTGLGGVNDYAALETASAVVQMPDMALSKTDGGANFVVGSGGPLTYTLIYTNVGNFTAPGVTITETLPAGTTFNATLSTAGWNCVASTCTYAVGSVVADLTGTVEFVVNVSPSLPGSSIITNTATIGVSSVNGPEATLANNTATETTPGTYRLFLPLLMKTP